jgi:hypothetical protein
MPVKTLTHQRAEEDILDGRLLDVIDGEEADVIAAAAGEAALPDPVVHEDARRGEVFAQLGELKMRRTDRTKVTYGDEELPQFTRLWDRNGVPSVVFTAMARQYLSKRDPQTGERIFFHIPPKVAPVPDVQCPHCRKKLINEDELDNHKRIRHKRVWEREQRQAGNAGQAAQLEVMKQMLATQNALIEKLTAQAAAQAAAPVKK